jgi:predicted helicase
MSQLLIQQYLNQLSTLKKVSGSQRESVLREAFKDLLKGWARSRDLHFIPEYEIESKTKERRYVDGALLHELRVPFGYWEAKDAKDDLDAMVEEKFKRGYPQDNIIFENNVHAVLIQNREEVMRAFVDDVKGLEKLLNLFFGYERKEIVDFRHAVDQFKSDLPAVLEGLRVMIDKAHAENVGFRKAAATFLAHAQETINPTLGAPDVREMLIQHILTEEIFSAVFPGTSFHKDNNVARELYKLEGTFFTGNTKFKTLKGLEPYYASIRSAAAQIARHHEKQTFLKVIYENFYKVYNKKAADRLGVVYTPNEIVRFMIESADWLCEKHFGRNLIDKEVEILDPATGTGTFICELLEHFRGQPAKLKHKYKRELHANEVAILPYYVANLNIEATHAAITGEYEEFPNLCFVDTLDNVAGLRKHAGHVDDLFGGVTDINIKRIRVQNSRRISVVIGNPPYNANQLNENENNKNREYPEIDKRIKETYIAASKAQKTKLYDMYSRFYRWASDRLDQNGVLAFITNRSFIEGRTFDGFRRTVTQEFNEIHLVDLGGDIRANPKLSGTTHNVFGIQTGVAIAFMVRKAKQKGCRIFYSRRPELELAEEKLSWLASSKLSAVKAQEIQSTVSSVWINQGAIEFEELLPLASKQAKSGAKGASTRALFRLFSLGVSTNRDEWVIDLDKASIEKKMKFFVQEYEKVSQRAGDFPTVIKWSRNLKRRLEQGRREKFTSVLIRSTLYRPYVNAFLYDSSLFIDERGSVEFVFPSEDVDNPVMCLLAGDRQPFSLVASRTVPNLNLYSADATKYIPLYRYDDRRNREENLSNWGMERFRARYQAELGKSGRRIANVDVFHYVYAVLHDPIYREKYALNLKREFPRIPFYKDFWQWSDWGKELMDLHIGYESVKPWNLKRTDATDEKAEQAGQAPKAMLKTDKESGRITLDSETKLEGVPPEAWDYKLGNRSALEWILDQYKESKPKDPTIREKFDTYRFADYKEKVVDLLARVTSVSVETQRIVDAMKKAQR